MATEREMINAVKAHALAHYNDKGTRWDYVVECFDDKDIADRICHCTTVEGAIGKMKLEADAYYEGSLNAQDY